MRRAVSVLLVLSLPAAAAAESCRADYERGFAEGVAAVNAQLGAVTERMQRDMQAQVNAQLAELDARRTRELETRLAKAQGAALSDQGPVTAKPDTARTGPAAGSVAMPVLPPLEVAPGGGIAPTRTQGRAVPDDPAALPPVRPSRSPIPRTCRPSCSGR